MQDTVVYMRGPLPFDFSFSLPESVWKALRVLLNLDMEQVHSIADKLDAHPGFMSWESVKQAVLPVVQDDATAKSVATLVTGIDERLRSLRTNLEVFLS